MKISGTRKKELDEAVIDEYFVNGFRGYKAVQTVRGNSVEAAKGMFNIIMKDEKNKDYIQQKRLSLRRKIEVENENILRELLNWVYVDISDFIGLTKDEIKALPPEVKRCIQSFKTTKRTYKDRGGQERTDEIIEIKLIDKTKAMEMVNKHVGFYESHNRQKRPKIDLNKFDTETLNIILNVIQSSNLDQ
jgi:hypothetical protein